MLAEVPRVLRILVEPPLVTPSSQIVGTQAVFNVLMGERYKMATKRDERYLERKIRSNCKNRLTKKFKRNVIGDTEVITCRPADLIPDELDTLKGEMAQWSQQDEDVLSYALFPQVATELL